MKLWKLSYHDDDQPSGQTSEWFTSKAAALKRRRELETNYEGTSVGFFVEDDMPQQVDVPTTRAALAEFLTGYDP